MDARSNRGTKEWQNLSDKQPSKEKLLYCTDEAAMKLLEVMVRDSAYEFEGGVSAYIKASQKLKASRRKLEHTILMGEPSNVIQAALDAYDDAAKGKRNAVKNIKNEYLFLNCERDVKPPIDGMYIMTTIIKNYIKGVDDETFKEIKSMINKARREKNE